MTMAEQCCNLSNRNLTDYIPPTKLRYNTLILDNNLLTNIKNVKYCNSLRQLSACYNEIEDMSPVGFLQNLKLLHLIDNVINKITGVGECSKLEELSLSRNCLQSFTGLHHCTSLTKIDLSYNSINTLADISSLTSLRELYLHGNEITTLESAPLCLPVCLSVLSLADNRISDIGQLAYLTRLRVLERLSLAGNNCANNCASPYQIFAVMCCPSVEFIDHEPLTPDTREHARKLEKKMLISGEASFSAIRDERPRVRERSKTDVSHSPTKENQPFAANVRDIRPPVADSPDDTLAGGSVNTAYDEYNNRPASSAMPRVRARRSSLVQSPFSPPIEPDGPPVGRRGRSQSVFTSPSSSRFEHLEQEMDSESVYLNISDDFSKCLNVTPELPEENVALISPLERSGSSEGAVSLQSEEAVTELRQSSGSDRLVVLPEFLFDLPDLTLLSQQEIRGVVKIQSVWRGYRSRKQNANLIMSLAVERYQKHYSVMTEQISQLTSDLNREKQLSSLYREMLYKMAGMLKEQKPTTRSRLTQTKRVASSDSHTQTQGLISTLLASFAVDTPHGDVQEHSSDDSDTDSSQDISSRSSKTGGVSNMNRAGEITPKIKTNENRTMYGTEFSREHPIELIDNAGYNISNSINKKFESASDSTNGFSSDGNHSRDPSNSGVSQNMTANSCSVSKYAELKKQFESPDHLAKIKSVSAGDTNTSTEVAASFIRNSIDSLRNSLARNKNSPSKLELSPNNFNSLSSSNGHEPLQDHDLILDQFKPAEDIRNESAN